MVEKMAVMKINGMSCAGCVSKIEGAIGLLEGVRNILVSLEKKKATVTFDETKVNQKKLRKVITECGYSVL